MRNADILVIVVLPREVGIIESDIAGRPAGDYLLESLGGWDGAEVRIIVDGGISCPGRFERHPSISGCELAELDAKFQEDRGVLIVDARAWLSRVALAGVFARARGAVTGFRIIESGRSGEINPREARTLALYLPSTGMRSNVFVQGRGRARQGLEGILRREASANAAVVDGSHLDVSSRALLIDSYEDIAELEQNLLLQRAILAMRHGVRIRDPNRVYIRGDLVCGRGVEIEINVVIEGRVALENHVKIGANSILRNCRVGANTRIHPFSLVEDSAIGSDSFVGPYGRIRPGSVIGDGVQIGNYVEIKNSRVGSGSRINHHTFIGDAVLASQVTIGAGTITCNHDGSGINQTIIERGAYVGSGCNLVAPLRIGEDAIVGAGSTITSDVPRAKLTVARSPQTTIENWRGPKATRESK
jgi:bifunctional UDP-N-acetylglucosamine pyrophosphorylase/glucosamine-1-phosphate N-acetyltransferase